MPTYILPPKNEAYEELTPGVSLDGYGDSHFISSPDDDLATEHLLSKSILAHESWWKRFYQSLTSIPHWRRLRKHAIRRAKKARKGRGWIAVRLRKVLQLAYYILGFALILALVVGAFFPSYTRLPPHYQHLRDRIQAGWHGGSANIHNERIFIVTNIVDPGGYLARGAWERNLFRLIHILGSDNVYLSIYENDSDEAALQALAELETRVTCNHTIISEPQLDFQDIPHVTIHDGTQRIKRIAYLAGVRNRALRPLDHVTTRFDKIFFLNDVLFDPIEAAQLLFSTNIGSDGKSHYRSACAVDFIDAFKFYDTFATRDLEGYSMGVPFFPWFPAIGKADSLKDVIRNTDAVRVKSCWGGMVAFDAQFFQTWEARASTVSTAGNDSPLNLTAPYRFRAEPDLYWDASECCLVQADIQNPHTTDTGVFMNPYVRVAYDEKTLSRLWLTKRFEKLFIPIHYIANILVSLPDFNPRREEVPWHSVEETIWVQGEDTTANGSWMNVTRIAKHDGYCGRRKLQVMKEGELQEGEANWEFINPPDTECYWMRTECRDW